MKVLVCGGRNYANELLLTAVLDRIHIEHGVSEIIHGGATGADALAGKWARGRSIYENVFRADWAKDGRSAGPRRNRKMIVDGKPDLVVAFPGGRGTADMVRQARKAGLKVMEV